MSQVVQELRRETVEACIEQLIALLDQMDGDPDLEDGGDFESSIGSSPKLVGSQIVEDLELDDCDYEEGGDEEPSLGWPNPEGLRVQIRSEAEQIAAFDFDDGPSFFDGSGHRIARALLRARRA
ncbi:hypothetical protein [Rhizobium phaseoli]|uniref:hypothetical protein n=1 Tax=Rhizobium phaseoli TaxID=396 RepID=UPI0014386702|nr:hypothetical protein [Rhizobium phaseoli]MDK4726407.1 hypothetical protein [Rhizobium phaseoli]NKE89583.1 hypothetical protein [Rhizobium phaseoli]